MGDEVLVSIPRFPDDHLGVKHDEPAEDGEPDVQVSLKKLFKSLCRCKHLHLQGYLEKQLGPKEDVKETEEEEGGEAREEGATKVEVLAIWSKESCPGKAGKDGGGKHES